MFAIIDIETTGGTPLEDKVIEIAIVLHDGEKILDSYSTLVNPERPIPWQITQLTGIDSRMVKDAPRFYEVAKKIVEFTADAIFVAHNVRFDYNFLRSEFHRLGYKYHRKQLCTVRLSRKLLPGQASYSLGRLCKGLGIEVNGRHRALGDAMATAQLLDMMLRQNDHREVFNNIEAEMNHSKLPPKLDADVLESLPTKPGVYYFRDEYGNLLYIGKSNHIRKRVMTHFNFNPKDTKAVEFKNSIAAIDTEVTGTDLIAQLLESAEIKKHSPPYNVSLKRNVFPYGIYLKENEQGYVCLQLHQVNPKHGDPLTVMPNMRSAKGTLFHWVETLNLCAKLSGLDKNKGACFNYHIGKCDGACVGEVEVDVYNQRIEPVLDKLQLPHPNALIVGPGRTRDEMSLVLISEGRYQGYGFALITESVNFFNADNWITNRANSRDALRILQRFFRTPHKERVIIPEIAAPPIDYAH